MIKNKIIQNTKIARASSHRTTVEYQAWQETIVPTLDNKSNSSCKITKKSPPHNLHLNHGYLNKYNYKMIFPLKSGELLDSYRLRAKVFCQELKWVGSNSTLFEIDEFDKNSSHLGIAKTKGSVVGTLRFTSHQHEWLMEKYFPRLLPENFRELKLPTSAEVSRMAVENDVRAHCTTDGKGVVELLYKGIFCYCQTRNITHIYIIVSTVVLRHLKMHRMPVRIIGPKVAMPDGVEAVAAVIDWSVLYQSDNIKDQIFLDWLKGPTPLHN